MSRDTQCSALNERLTSLSPSTPNKKMTSTQRPCYKGCLMLFWSDGTDLEKERKKLENGKREKKKKRNNAGVNLTAMIEKKWSCERWPASSNSLQGNSTASLYSGNKEIRATHLLEQQCVDKGNEFEPLWLQSGFNHRKHVGGHSLRDSCTTVVTSLSYILSHA